MNLLKRKEGGKKTTKKEGGGGGGTRKGRSTAGANKTKYNAAFVSDTMTLALFCLLCLL